MKCVVMTRIICMASGKGGVGKTVTTANIATALAEFNKSVIAIDGNLTTANLGLHLGIPFYPVSIQDVLRGRAKLRDSIYHHSSGFRVIPADIAVSKTMTPNPHKLLNILYKFVGDADFVLVDSAAGLGKEAESVLKASDEMITVTTPDMPALTDALKLGRIAEKFGTVNLGVIVNKVRNDHYEFPVKDVEDFLGVPLIGKVPEDYDVMRAIHNKMPVVSYSPRSRAAEHFRAIAAGLIGEEYSIRRPVFHRVFGWLKG